MEWAGGGDENDADDSIRETAPEMNERTNEWIVLNDTTKASPWPLVDTACNMGLG